jgi:anthranilate synthase component II
MTIGIIDNFDSFVYNLVRYVREFESTRTIVQRNDHINVQELDQCDALLLSPGPGIPAEAGALMDVIERYKTSKPMLGVCLGHQALGQSFGGILQPCPKPIHGKASEMQVFSEGILFKELPGKLAVGRYHSWQLLPDPDGELLVTGRTRNRTVMAIQHRTLPICGVQFHPESILTPHGRTMINNWLKSIR